MVGRCRPPPGAVVADLAVATLLWRRNRSSQIMTVRQYRDNGGNLVLGSPLKVYRGCAG
jgi:hypothetical protein